MEADKVRHHFVFVHGGCHGAWCWYKLVTSLRMDGHHVTAVDLAAAGTSTKLMEEIVSMSDYSWPLIEFMSALPPDERVVLVGHSLGGASISFAMEKFPEKIAVAVFVTAMMPSPGFGFDVVFNEHVDLTVHPLQYMDQVSSFMDSRFSFADGDDKPPTSFLFGPEYMASSLYQLSPPEDLTLATLLLRPQSFHGIWQWLREDDLTEQNYGSVRRVFVICEQDQTMKRRYQEWLIEKNPPDEVVVISGADHMPMISKPEELWDCIRDLAAKYG